MPCSARQVSWSEFLDAEGQNKLISRYVLAEDFGKIEEFALVYVTIIDGEAHEVIRYDCSSDETVHVHRFFRRPPEKTYLEKGKTLETMEELTKHIRANWRLYLARFLER